VASALAMIVAGAPPASAQTVVAMRKVERGIVRGLTQQTGVAVTVKCPARVPWSKGRQFECTVRALDGARYRVTVTLGAKRKGVVRWKVVA
jgi:hypothetical protein